MTAPMQNNQRLGHTLELFQSIIKTCGDNHNSLSMHGKVKADLNKGF